MLDIRSCTFLGRYEIFEARVSVILDNIGTLGFSQDLMRFREIKDRNGVTSLNKTEEEFSDGKSDDI